MPGSLGEGQVRLGGPGGGGALEGGRGDRTEKPGGNLDGLSGAGSVLLAKERLRAFCLFFDSFNIRVLAERLPRACFMPPTGSPVTLFSVGNPYQERRPPARLGPSSVSAAPPPEPTGDPRSHRPRFSECPNSLPRLPQQTRSVALKYRVSISETK